MQPPEFTQETMFPADFFTRHPLVCATELIGCSLVWERCSGIIVETEAYTAKGDEACHTFLRRGAQLFVDSNPAGTAYIYLNYGVHWLVNVLVKHAANDGFVLIRALEPTHGLSLMEERRKLTEAAKLCSGPGKLTQALGITAAAHGTSLCRHPQYAFHRRSTDKPEPQIIADLRIGITKAADLPWRFLLKDSRFVSRRAGAGAELLRGDPTALYAVE